MMRQFSEIEKKILEAICAGNNQMANLVCLFLENETVRVSKANGTSPMAIFIDLKKFEGEEIVNRAYSITEKIVVIVNLLKYLEAQSLITYFLPSHGRVFSGNYTRSQELYNYWQNHKTEYTEWIFTDEKTQTYIIENTDYIILPTEELKVHLQNKYKTKEEIRYKNQMIATWVAIAVSLLLGLFGIYQNAGKKTQEIILDKKQKEELFEIISATKKRLNDSVTKTTVRNSNSSCCKKAYLDKKKSDK